MYFSVQFMLTILGIISAFYLLFPFIVGQKPSFRDVSKKIVTLTAIVLATQLVDTRKFMQATGIGLNDVRIEIATVTGTIETTGETFSGHAWAGNTTYPGIHVRTSTGSECFGGFQYSSKSNGHGHFGCNDSRTGTFKFNVADLRGQGTGKIGDKTIEFVFTPGRQVSAIQPN